MESKDFAAHDDTGHGKGSLSVEAGKSDIGTQRTGGLVELVAVQGSHSVQGDHFGVALEAVAHRGIVVVEATWTPHSRFLHLDAPLRGEVRA